MRRSVCIFCSSSDAIDAAYFDATRTLGLALAATEYDLVFGGGDMGLMGAVARTMKAEGARVTGVIPTALNREGIAFTDCDELIVTRDMRERKSEMDTRSDAFIALPGGFGTLEEVIEHVTLKQLRVHPKPVILLNTLGFYDPLLRFFDHLIAERFAKPEHREVYYVAEEPAAVMHYLDAYEPAALPDKYV